MFWLFLFLFDTVPAGEGAVVTLLLPCGHRSPGSPPVEGGLVTAGLGIPALHVVFTNTIVEVALLLGFLQGFR